MRAETAMNDTATHLDLPDGFAYLPYYRLQAVPFRASADPGLLWLGRMHRAVLEMLTAAIRHSDGVVLLTGDVGAGKTILATGLAERLSDEGLIVGRVSNSGFEIADFFQAVAGAYRIEGTFHTRDTFVAAFREVLGNAGSTHRRVLLIVDEAQSLSHEILQEIRDLSSLGAAQGHSLAVLLVGQKELSALLSEQRHAALRQRITTRCAVEPLTADEVGDYIRHRLQTAGSGERIFSSAAIREITTLSRGAPAAINILCERALLAGHRRQARTINREIVRGCRWTLGSPPRTGAPGVRAARRLVRSVRRAGEAGALERRGRTGAKVSSGTLARHVAMACVMLVALVLIIGAYPFLAARFTRTDDSTQEAARDLPGQQGSPERAESGTAPVAVGATDVPRGAGEPPIAAPIAGAPELLVEQGARDSANPASVTAMPPAQVKAARPRNRQRRAGAVSVEAQAISRAGTDEEGERLRAAGGPAPTSQAGGGEAEAPDAGGVIEWLAKDSSSGRRPTLPPD